MADATLPQTAAPCTSAPSSTPESLGLLRAEEVDTIAKSIAFLVQEMLLRGFDAISHADLGARIGLILGAMPSGRPIVLAMQAAIMDENFALALDHARLLVEREAALMALARTRLEEAAREP